MAVERFILQEEHSVFPVYENAVLSLINFEMMVIKMLV